MNLLTNYVMLIFLVRMEDGTGSFYYDDREQISPKDNDRVAIGASSSIGPCAIGVRDNVVNHKGSR